MRTWTYRWAKSISHLAGQCVTRTKSVGLNLKSPTTERTLETRNTNSTFFFILSLGRSGSLFLAQLLNQAPTAHVCHEPVRADFIAYPAAFHHPDQAIEYVLRFRRKDIYRRAYANMQDVYGEVNSNLRRHAQALKEALPHVIRLHLVRDGRDVVRSMMSRRTFLAWDPVTILIHPDYQDPWSEAWSRMNRFEKLCWYWTTENRYLRNVIGQTVNFEKILSDYDYFASKLLAPIGLVVSEKVWSATKQHPKNATPKHKIPHWSSWDDEKKQTFEKICADEMHANGYEIKWV